MELKTPEYYEKLVQERYKNIEKTVLENGMIIFECWKDETKSIECYVKVIFDGDVVYYHGDMGTYVFNKNIHNALRFFSWKINLPYWEEKLEAAFRPSTIEEIDLDELEAKLIETLKDEGIDITYVNEDGSIEYEDLLDSIHFAFYNIHEHHIAAYNKLYDALKDEWREMWKLITTGQFQPWKREWKDSVVSDFFCKSEDAIRYFRQKYEDGYTY